MNKVFNIDATPSGREILETIIETGITDSYFLREAVDLDLYRSTQETMINNSKTNGINSEDDIYYEAVIAEILLQGYPIPLKDDESGEEYLLTLEKIDKVVNSMDFMLVLLKNQYSNLDLCTWDAEIGDWIIQTALFGEVVYG